MTTFLECWQQVARALLGQALAGAPTLEDAPSRTLAEGALGFGYILDGDLCGLFGVSVDEGVVELPLLGEGVDQNAAWDELLREVVNAACAEMLSDAGQRIRVARVDQFPRASSITKAFQFRCGNRSFFLTVTDELTPEADPAGAAGEERGTCRHTDGGVQPSARELLLDVELETTLRFGCRELPLADLLELGPGDVVPLDRQVNDPVDLIVGDKIVARGEVVLVNGNFGLRVTEVAEPRKRLETIRCLF